MQPRSTVPLRTDSISVVASGDDVDDEPDVFGARQTAEEDGLEAFLSSLRREAGFDD